LTERVASITSRTARAPARAADRLTNGRNGTIEIGTATSRREHHPRPTFAREWRRERERDAAARGDPREMSVVEHEQQECQAQIVEESVVGRQENHELEERHSTTTAARWRGRDTSGASASSTQREARRRPMRPERHLVAYHPSHVGSARSRSRRPSRSGAPGGIAGESFAAPDSKFRRNTSQRA
jgi:hypothetical protein